MEARETSTLTFPSSSGSFATGYHDTDEVASLKEHLRGAEESIQSLKDELLTAKSTIELLQSKLDEAETSLFSMTAQIENWSITDELREDKKKVKFYTGMDSYEKIFMLYQ